MYNKNLFSSNKLIEISKKAVILEKDEEFMLINDWRDNKTPRSLQKILNSYLRLAISYARKYSSYGLPIDDLIHEGVLGIMHALEKFDTSKDFRLSTYASWWIRASIQDYILKNWSVVRTGSTASQKALFFNLKKIKQQISDVSREFMGQDEINKVSNMLNVKSIDIQNMESRLTGGDLHLNQKVDTETENDLMSLLADERQNPEESFEEFNDKKIKKDFIEKNKSIDETIISNYFDYIKPKLGFESIFRLLSPLLHIFFSVPHSKIYKSKINEYMKDQKINLIEDLLIKFVSEKKLG